MKRLICVLSTFLSIASAANAQTKTPPPPEPYIAQTPKPLAEKTGYVGGALGLAAANHQVGAGLGYGADLAFFPQKYFGIGALFRAGDQHHANSRLYGGQVVLRPWETLAFGFVLGGANLTEAAANDGTAIAYGPRVSYDFRLGQTPFSVGPEIDWFFFKPGSSTISHVNALALLKLWM